MKGRKPKRQELRAVDGTDRANPERAKEIVPVRDDRPEPTAIVKSNDLTLALWHETCDTLQNMKFLCLEDAPLIEAYVLNYTLLLGCIQSMFKDGDTSITRDGGSKASGAATNYGRYSATHIKLLQELGLTPVARQRLAPPQSRSKEEDNPVGNLLKKLGGG